MSSIGDGVHDDLCPYMPEPYEECQCHIVKVAYLRGREDAAETILKSMWHEDDCISNRNPKTCNCAVGTAAEYARGVGEQE